MAVTGRAVAVFLRYPEAGRVKTRLAASVGEHAALRIYCKLLRRTLGIAADFKTSNADVEIFLFFTPAAKRGQLVGMFPGPWQLVAQHGRHLGERMQRALEHILAAGHRHVVLVGSDLADLQTADFVNAFQSVAEGYAVLGPALDGGFYLLGIDRPCPSVFAPDRWGGPEVFRRTEQLLLNAGFKVRTGPARKDIDRPEDLDFLSSLPDMRERLSVIIPTRKPIEELAPLLKIVSAGLWPDDEIIVSSSARQSLSNNEQMSARGRQSRTHPLPPPFRPKPESAILRRPCCPTGAAAATTESATTSSTTDRRLRQVYSPAGRGVQMNRGAEAACGGLYWFLHDDSIPPSQFAYHIRKLLLLPDKSLGCFLAAFFPSTRALDLIAGWATLRTVYCGRPYGDQGLFCRAETFDHLGGFHKAFLMEDVDFVSRARRLGGLLIVREKLFTSAARYLSRGVLRASLHNHLTMLSYLAGVDDRKLYTRYYGVDDFFTE